MTDTKRDEKKRTDSTGAPLPARELGYDQTAVPAEHANETPTAVPTQETAADTTDVPEQ